jgi:hypothetical protein
MPMRSAVVTGVLLLAGTSAFAQDESARRAAVEVAARVPFEKAFKGAPYSAETVIESSQTLADGNRINRKTSGRVYRDTDGRTRREEDRDFSAITPNGPVSARMTSISIVDPVAGFSYSLDPEHKIAWRTTIGAAGGIMGKVEAAATDERRKLEAEKAMTEKRATVNEEEAAKVKARIAQEAGQTSEMKERAVAPSIGIARTRGGLTVADSGPLEHKTLEGIAVEGRKNTTTIPAGQIGNEQPLTIVSEEWRSPELNVLVMTRHADPRSGESIYRLQNIVRAEPDRSLFMVPPDYQIKETGIRRMEEARNRR